ncbi:thiaminase II [Pelagivirga sediminicola]|uniref:Thiaminase II n=1 Tax=Pelagivirga sediminicola TaxID=2170575 RepID=A0A2T7G4G4_9RHOB|nr:TenA family protein [Pelagivirga sediminicola]PVA09276.1 thiaminase II [Pelagivirga sediminicola]
MMYGETFAAWRAEAAQDWHAYTHHPFVEGLKDGTLPREAFLRYLVQDYVFLIHFSRAWALAVVKAGTVAEMRFATRALDVLLNEEIALHVATCAREGIDEATLFAAPEAVQNIAYTRYVLDAGHSGDFLDLLAALVPCVLGYGEIGLRLASSRGNASYGDWIETYAGDAMQTACHEVGALLDSAVARRLGPSPQASPRWDALSQRFATAVRLEIGFWDMGLTG